MTWLLGCNAWLITVLMHALSTNNLIRLREHGRVVAIYLGPNLPQRKWDGPRTSSNYWTLHCPRSHCNLSLIELWRLHDSVKQSVRVIETSGSATIDSIVGTCNPTNHQFSVLNFWIRVWEKSGVAECRNSSFRIAFSLLLRTTVCACRYVNLIQYKSYWNACGSVLAKKKL